MNTLTTATVHALVALGMLAVVPLGLRLVPDEPALRRLRLPWLLGAVAGATSLWLPAGPGAAALAGGYALAAAALALLAARRLLRRTRRPGPSAAELALATAWTCPLVAAIALVPERAGTPFLGFGTAILALTVAHFHYAGFAAALVAALAAGLHPTDAATPPRPATRLAALSVPGGTLTVLAGYFVSEFVELLGALWLTAGMWLVAWHTWRHQAPAAPRPLTRAMLAVSAISLLVTMPLALWWAVGEAYALPRPGLGWMVATHGVGNALGFALCAVLAHTRLTRRPTP
ncbi:YndJ family transporter [Allostreptomyces psammosilenae]|uniref:YndJ-like protein n=1 Tax=Allostreptomyces psammosilenae TaxID=1892865 RepID=A0A852ZN34_9ACTN|nr:YndJ family transporter [Allostreptomyces psammosilenae]NYI03823.1 hypothetical protein [Allostreptomyces psammosilenae]